MKHPDYHLHGGVCKHIDGSFTMSGTIWNPEPTLFTQRYYNYTLADARKDFKREIKRECGKYFVAS